MQALCRLLPYFGRWPLSSVRILPEKLPKYALAAKTCLYQPGDYKKLEGVLSSIWANRAMYDENPFEFMYMDCGQDDFSLVSLDKRIYFTPIIMSNNRIAAWASLNRETQDFTAFVCPGYKRQGCGSQLVRTLVAHAKTLPDVQSIQGSVSVLNYACQQAMETLLKMMPGGCVEVGKSTGLYSMDPHEFIYRFDTK